MSGTALVYVLTFGLVFVFIAIIVIVAVAAHAADRKRRERLQAEVRQYGWQYVPEADARIQDRYHGRPFPAFGRGRVRDVVTGRHRGRDFQAFQFSYTTSSGESSSTHYFVHVAVLLPAVVPPVEIRSRGFGSKIAEAFSSQVFHLGVPEFDERFTVRAAFPGFADALLRSGLAPWLTRLPYANPLILEGTELRTWIHGKLEAQTLPPLVEYLCAALEQIPAAVWPEARR